MGETRVTASYPRPSGTLYATTAVVVLERDTYKVNGRITDSGHGVANVAVTVLSGVGAGLTTLSASDGSYAVYGVAGRVRFQARRDGYHDRVEELEISTSATHDFEIVPDRQRTNLSGNYILTLEMGICDDRSSPLAADARRRVYMATIAQEGPELAVTLSGAAFVIRDGRGDHFAGALDPTDNVTFQLGNPDDVYFIDYATLVERIDATTAFLVYGAVSGRVTSTGIVGTLTGSLITADLNNPSYWFSTGWCYSAAHPFEMRRQ